MINTLYLPELREMLADKDTQGLKDFCEALHHPYQTAEFMEGLSAPECWEVLKCAPDGLQMDIFEYLPWDKQLEILQVGDRKEIGVFVGNLPPDDRVDLLTELPEKVYNEIMRMVPETERHDIQRLSQYDDQVAGAIMTTEVAILTEDLTPREALEEARRQAEEMETIYYLYVVDKEKHLRGLLTFRKLISSLGKPRVTVADIMDRNLITVKVDDDKENVAQLVAKHDFLALPVVDDEYHLLGIVTHDDLMDVVIEEAEEDAYLSAAVAPLEETYIGTPIPVLVWKRGLWLVVLFFGAMLTAMAINHYNSLLATTTWLVLFVPMIVSAGGNSGNQSATLIITALTNGTIKTGDVLHVLMRELLIGFWLGAIIATVGVFYALFFTYSAHIDILATIILPVTLVFVVTVGSVLGAMLPIFFNRIGLDPALMSNPFVAGMVDVLGIIIYMNVAFCFIR